MRPKAVNEIKSSQEMFGSSEKLNHILLKAGHLRQLEWLVQGYLSAEIREHCHVANIQQGILILHLDNASWLQALRFELSALLSYLRQTQEGRGISSIKPTIKPQHTATPSLEVPIPTKEISTASRALLLETAENIMHPDLAASLKRLAKHDSSQ